MSGSQMNAAASAERFHPFSSLPGRCPSPAAGEGACAFETKRAGASLLPLGVEGAFEGYASLFGLADLGRDVVMPGAFRETIRTRGPAGVRMLWQHDATAPIGVWDELIEDQRGLYVSGRLDLSVARAREALALMRSGAVDGLSIGYRTARSRRDPATGLRRLEAIDLMEISLVTFPMLPQARVSAVKGGGPDAAARRLDRAIRRAAAALRSL